MKIATGKVIGGKVVVEGDVLTEGATVTVVARESDETFEVSPEQEAALLNAIAEADRGDFVSSDQILEMRLPPNLCLSSFRHLTTS